LKTRPQDKLAVDSRHDYKEVLSRIIGSYDSAIVRGYCTARFSIININILHLLALCLRGKRKVLDLGCGFGLFGLYFSMLYPDIVYCGYDMNAKRVDMANRSAKRLGVHNTTFRCQDVRDFSLDEHFDAVMTIDLMHHLDNDSKNSLLATCARHLASDGRLIVKDVTTRPFHRLAFTWVLDVLMTRGCQMWYWNETEFNAACSKHFNRLDTFPISDWMPYPHVVYLCENV
jgi:cyclopropane fatty-acyl-phospholipid synthase-like methyltransferase